MASKDIDSTIQDIYKRMQQEKKIVEGFRAMSMASTNPDTQKSCQSKIRDSEKFIQWFEDSLRDLQKRRAQEANSSAPSSSGYNTPSSSSSSLRTATQSTYSTDTSLSSTTPPVSGSQRPKVLPPTPGSLSESGSRMGSRSQSSAAVAPGGGNAPNSLSVRRKPNFTHLDLIKYDTPLNSAKISKMLNQLEFKLRVEKEYMQGIEKMAKLYQVEGDKRARSDAEAKRIESKGKKDLLETALKRYKTLDIMGGVFDEEDAGDDDDAKGLRRKPVSGALQITVKSARDLDHLPSNKRKPTETVVVVKVEDTPRSRTHPSRTDRWNEDFELHVDKANEVEVTIYDKPPGTEPPTPIGMLWIRLSDLVDELRRKKVGAEAGAGWVTAPGLDNGSAPGINHQHSGSMGGSQALDTPVATHLPSNAQSAALRPGTAVDGIDAWFTVEPAGQIDLHLNFIKSNVRKRPYDAGGLGRQGAVRKRKEEIMEQNGHKFIQKQFYGVVLCAFCQEFLLKAAGMQCEDCRYTCHKKCYDKVVTKCVSKSNAETDKDGDKINHRVPHRFEPMTSMSPSWCCHCGQIVPLSRKKARRCTECNLSCHVDCAHLVPDFCGISMEIIRQLLGDIQSINKSRTVAVMQRPQQTPQISAIPPVINRPGYSQPSSPSRLPASPSVDSINTAGNGRMQADPSRRQPPPPTQQQQQQQQQSPARFSQQGPAPVPYPHDQSAITGRAESAGNAPPLQQQRQSLQGRLPIPPDPPKEFSATPAAPAHNRQQSYGGLPPGAAPPQMPAQISDGGRKQPMQGQQQQTPPQQMRKANTPAQRPYSQMEGPPTQTQGPRPMSDLQQPQQSLLLQQQQQQQQAQQQQAMKIDQRMPFTPQQQRPPPVQQRQSQQYPLPGQGSTPTSQMPRSQSQQQMLSPPTTPSKTKPVMSPGNLQAQPSSTTSSTAMAVALQSRKVGLDDFNFLAVLGKGNFGKVMLAEEKRSNRLWAIKVLKKEFIIENEEIESTRSEKRVFLAAARERHPFLLDLHSCFQTETRIYFVMEYVSGGDLMLHIQREQFTPRRARFYAAEVLLALEYFHKQGIVYRDLKLDNILLTLDGHVKVADYGLCKENMWFGRTTHTFCGTPEFMAPEILLEQRYGRAVDWWAFGVLIYEMLLGQSPFRGDDEDEIFDAILEDEPLYPIHMPRASVSILQQLLCRDPMKRLGAGVDDAMEIKAHIFFKDIIWEDIMQKRVPAPYFPTISGPLDTSNFDAEFTREQPTLTPVHSQLSAQDQREFRDFSWIGPAALEQ